jgi:radical SAM superfamily enzyme YgiQ (UPF0313 family)
MSNILQEMEFLVEHYNVKYFRFYDEMFLGGIKSKVHEFCHELIKSKLPVFWWCWTNGNLVDRETLSLMRKAGCIDISFGLESGSKVILEEMDKKCNIEHHFEMIKYANSIGLRANASWLTGTFSENKTTLEESKKFFLAVYNFQYHPTLLHKLIPLPGTRIFEQAIAAGKIKNAYEYLRSFEEINTYRDDTWHQVPNLNNLLDFDATIAQIKDEINTNTQKKLYQA